MDAAESTVPHRCTHFDDVRQACAPVGPLALCYGTAGAIHRRQAQVGQSSGQVPAELAAAHVAIGAQGLHDGVEVCWVGVGQDAQRVCEATCRIKSGGQRRMQQFGLSTSALLRQRM